MQKQVQILTDFFDFFFVLFGREVAGIPTY